MFSRMSRPFAGSRRSSPYWDQVVALAWDLLQINLRRGYCPLVLERVAVLERSRLLVGSDSYAVLTACLYLLHKSFPTFCVAAVPTMEAVVARMLDGQIAAARALHREIVDARREISYDQNQGIDENLARQMSSLNFRIQRTEARVNELEARSGDPESRVSSWASQNPSHYRDSRESRRILDERSYPPSTTSSHRSRDIDSGRDRGRSDTISYLSTLGPQDSISVRSYRSDSRRSNRDSTLRRPDSRREDPRFTSSRTEYTQSTRRDGLDPTSDRSRDQPLNQRPSREPSPYGRPESSRDNRRPRPESTQRGERSRRQSKTRASSSRDSRSTDFTSSYMFRAKSPRGNAGRGC